MKRYNYNGHLIIKDAFRFRVTSLPWGENASEVPSFKTLTAAKSFIDRMVAQGK